MSPPVAVVTMLAVVILVSAASRRLPLPAPLFLTVVGVIASFLPGVPDFELSPELVLIGFLPPLLYAAALKTSLIDFRRNVRPIALLSVGLIIVNTAVVGFVVWWLLPVPAAAAFALGAVVAPPDAVAATAIARRVGMPRRLLSILQGESLVNDATALVALRSAIAAGSITIWEVGLDFVFTAIGGIAVGVVVAVLTGRLRFYVKDEVTDTAISIITPFVSYLVAEEFHWSGVLAVVITGLLLSHKSHLMQSASSRVHEKTNWATFEFILENTVFLLIGLQVVRIVEAAGASELPARDIVVACVAVTFTVILVRPIWVFPATYLPRLIPAVRAKDPFPPWTHPAAVSWAGMRGVVTLAAAFILPPETPHREVLILIALVVVAVTLLVQGSTLPWVLRHLRLGGPDPAEDALQAASVQQRAAAAGLARLEELVSDSDRSEVVDRVRRRSSERSEAMWERLGSSDETPSRAYARLRVSTIAAEREKLIELRNEGLVPDDILRDVMHTIDVEETVLDVHDTWGGEQREEVLTAPASHAGCEHIRSLDGTPQPTSPDGCARCLAEGTEWVHLRMCMTCGYVGCCDSSPNRHASAHYGETDHKVIRSFEPGEAWRWCFADEVLG